MSTSPAQQAGSQIAWLQRLTTLVIGGSALLAAGALWPSSPALAVMAGAAVAAGHAWVLALEFLVLGAVASGDAVPVATPGQRLRAWVAEVIQGWRVFAWRQPFRWRQVPDRLCGEGVPGRRGVVLVHGFVCNRGFWTPWLHRLRAQRRACVAVNLEPPFGSIDRMVPVLHEAVAQVRAATGLPPRVICHSMGGLVARAWLRDLRAAGEEADAWVERVVTIGTPHAGTWLARFSQARNGQQMRRDSEWLRRLEQAWVAGMAEGLPARFTCWYSNADNIVLPPSTATRPGADNRLVQGAAHVDMAFRAEVIDGSLAGL